MKREDEVTALASMAKVRREEGMMREGGAVLLRFREMERLSRVEHGLSTRGGGVSAAPFASLNLALHVGDREADVIENRRRFAAGMGLRLVDLCFAEQVHGADIGIVEEAQRGRGARAHDEAMPGADALVTDRVGLGLVILVADCVPLLLTDPRRGVVAAAHAGWRGTVQGVARRTVALMGQRFGSRPEDIVAGIGPAIGPAHFEVGPEVAAAFVDAFAEHAVSLVSPGPGDRSFVDLWAANRLELEQAGLRPERIEAMAISTYANADQFFSHRAEGGRTGRFAAGIALRGRA